MSSFLNTRLQKRKEMGLLRTLQSSSGLVDLTSNDYFGFAREKGMYERFSAGATGSRLLTGNHSLYEELEEEIARFHRAGSGLIYTSGYQANLGLLSTLEGTFLYDVAVHASMIDGLRLSRAKSLPFRHNDLDSLQKRLKRASFPIFVLVESLYSMSGAVAPLREIAALCVQYGAELIVDEAHATGICGPHGEGRVVALGLESQVFARIHTFSKALGAHGAAVLGSKTLKEYLLNFSRPLIYTTALPPITLAQIRSNYRKLFEEAPLRQRQLQKLIDYFCKQTGAEIGQTPIRPIYFPEIERLRFFAQKIREKGLDVRPILPPMVPRGKGGLRLVLHSFNREAEIDRLIGVLQ